MFEAVLGHPRAKSLLGHAIESHRPAHAYLILGPARSGKRSLARAFAQALLCQTEVQRPCQTCQSCRLFLADAHPDLRLIERGGPDERKKGRAPKNIPIEQIRSLQHDASLSSHLGGFKVYIVAEAEALSLAALDSLLKTLEEPASRVVIVLTCTDAGLLPPTVVSRCQVVKLGLVPPQEIEAALVARGTDPETAQLVAHLADGRPGRAIELASDPATLEDRTAALAEILDLDRAGRFERLKLAERMAQEHGKNADATGRRLEQLLIWWRDVLLVVAGCEEQVVNWDRLPDLRTRASRLTVAEARSALRAVEQASQYIAENVQARLALEHLVLTLPGAA